MRRALRKIVLAGLPLALVLGAAAAIAYFSSTGSGSATASVGGLSAPTITGATGGVGTVALSWSTVSPLVSARIGSCASIRSTRIFPKAHPSRFPRSTRCRAGPPGRESA